MRAALVAAVALAALAGDAGEARAEFYSGDLLWDLCTTRGDESQRACLGFIAAAADALSAQEDGRRQACIPIDIRLGPVRDVVVAYLRAHPEDRYKTAISLAAAALAEAFPCR